MHGYVCSEHIDVDMRTCNCLNGIWRTQIYIKNKSAPLCKQFLRPLHALITCSERSGNLLGTWKHPNRGAPKRGTVKFQMIAEIFTVCSTFQMRYFLKRKFCTETNVHLFCLEIFFLSKWRKSSHVYHAIIRNMEFFRISLMNERFGALFL